jgi:hypothetical protein
MFRLISAFFFTIFLAGTCKACDVCGCATGSVNFGILPQFHKHFVGLNYSYRSFLSSHNGLGITENSVSKEVFQSLELRTRINLAPRLHLFAFMPLQMNKQTEGSLLTSIKGPGDFSTFLNYSLLLTADSLNKAVKHNLQAGAGIKLPFGRYTLLDGQSQLNPNIQTGTGSYDFLIDALYTIRFNKLGINTTAFYKFNSTNSNQYRFGNKLSLASTLFYWVQKKSTLFLPGAGITYENAAMDSHNMHNLSQSGGSVMFASCSIDLYVKQFTCSLAGQLPVQQSNSHTIAQPRFNASVVCNF